MSRPDMGPIFWLRLKSTGICSLRSHIPQPESRHTIPLSPGFARSRSHIPQPEGRHTIPLSPGFAHFARTSPSRRAGTQSPSLRDLLAHARTSPSRLRRGWANKSKKHHRVNSWCFFDLFAVRGGFILKFRVISYCFNNQLNIKYLPRSLFCVILLYFA